MTAVSRLPVALVAAAAALAVAGPGVGPPAGPFDVAPAAVATSTGPLSRLATAVTSYVDSRPGVTSVAFLDLRSGRDWAYRGRRLGVTGSIVKVATVMQLLRVHGYPLDPAQQDLATQAITVSDNDAETELCRQAGDAPSLQRLYDRLGMQDTVAAPCTTNGVQSWGHTTTTARDQLLLLHALARHSRVIGDRGRHYVLGLMRHVVPSQRWGVPHGIPDGVAVAVKNGWRSVPDGSGWWQLNSIGFVQGLGRGYLLAVLNQSPESGDLTPFDVGTTTDDGVGVRVWRNAPRHYRYRFPVKRCATDYTQAHHDYPATDIFAARGCRFVAPVAGVVDEISRRDSWDPSVDAGATRGGRFVSIVGIDGVRYYGSHLEHVTRGLRPGDAVHRGQVLGRVGNSGSARGIATHLHFGISWPTRDGIWWVRRGEVGPYRFLESWRIGEDRSPRAAVRRALADAGRRVPPCSVDC
jgi:hypothetical protein